MKRGAGYVVELLGPPGVGTKELSHALSQGSGVRVVEARSFPGIATVAAATPHALGAARSHPPPGVDRAHWAGWAWRLAATSRVARHQIAAGASTVVFDQGAAHALVRMLDVRRHPAGNKWWWRRSIETAELLDLLVVLDADTDTLFRRVTHGGAEVPMTQGWSAHELREQLDRERTACHVVADVLAREGAPTRRLITTDLPVHKQAELVQALLHKRLPQPA